MSWQQTTYQQIGRTLRPALPALLRWRASRGLEDSARLAEKLGDTTCARGSEPLLWVHAASVGETLSVLPFLNYLSQQQPNWRFLLTTVTITAAQIIAQRPHHKIIHQYAPLDSLPIIEKFLNHWQPQGYMLVESELWPTTLACLAARQLPAIYLNARLSARSLVRWRMAGNMLSDTLNQFTQITVQDAASVAALQSLTMRPVSFHGHLKAAAPPPPLDAASLVRLKSTIGARPMWLMACSHAGEEELALSCHQYLRNQWPDILTIIAPRHPARTQALASRLRSAGLAVARRSTQDFSATTDILLADTLGEMGLWYALSELVVMGGSFVPKGGHNPLEAAWFDCAIITGPDVSNQSGLVAPLLSAGGLQQTTAAGLAPLLANLLQDGAKRLAMQQAAKNYVSAAQQTLPALWQAIQPWWQQIASKVPDHAGA